MVVVVGMWVLFGGEGAGGALGRGPGVEGSRGCVCQSGGLHCLTRH